MCPRHSEATAAADATGYEEDSPIEYRQRATEQLPDGVGVYVLCDLDHVPVYVGSSVNADEDGIKGRVARHLTGARSDVVANRQLDVWEVAWVTAYVMMEGERYKALDSIANDKEHPNQSAAHQELKRVARDVDRLERCIFVKHNAEHELVNVIQRTDPGDLGFGVPLPQDIPVMTERERQKRLTPSIRLARQAWQFAELMDYYITVKDAPQMIRSIKWQQRRINRYIAEL